jgi:hypothetical protein
MDCTSHGFGLLEVVPLDDLIDEVVFESDRAGYGFVKEVAAVAGEKVGGVLAFRQAGHAKAESAAQLLEFGSSLRRQESGLVAVECQRDIGGDPGQLL